MAVEDGPKGSLDRGLELLNHLAQTGEATTSEIVEAIGSSRSAVYRLVERLEALEFITSVHGRWRLGPAAARLAMAAVRTVDVLDAAPPLLRELARSSGETVGLGVLSGQEIVFVFRELGRHSLQVRAELGARRPLHATSIGKAYLSGLDDDARTHTIEQLRLDRFTDTTITEQASLHQALLETRRRGWSEEHGEFDTSTACFGAPVFDHSGAVIAAISVAGPATRMDGSAASMGPLVSATAAAISRRLGFAQGAQPAAS